MRILQELLDDLDACQEARNWVGDKTIEEAVAQCHRGDWMLWLARKVGVGFREIMLAEGHCANSVRHLMKHEANINAIDAAIAFGEGRASREEFDAAYDRAKAAAKVYTDADVRIADEAREKKQTADICRRYIGQDIIDKVNQTLKQ